MTKHLVWMILFVAAISLGPSTPSATAQTVQFASHRDYSSGYGPASIAIGDIDGDQQQDLATANNLDDTVAVLLGEANGTFRAPTSVYLGPNNGPRSVAIGDFNQDGHADLAVANAASGTISILPGNGDGTFQPVLTLAAGAGPGCVAVSDFNHDGRPDLVTANTASNDVSVLLGNGDGTFQAARTFLADVGPAFVAVADFNRDGRSDLAVANTTSGTVSVLAGNGDGTFQAARTFGAGTAVWAVTAGDFNGDGALDLAAANNGADTVAVLLGNGDATFQSAQTFAAGSGPTSVATGDFNGDSRPDLAVANERNGTIEGEGTVSVLIGNGDGTFAQPLTFAVGATSWSVAVGSFNDDGTADLAVANTYSTTVSVLLGRGDGTFPSALTLAVGSNPEGLTAGDFNGDGRQDLAAANAGSNTVSVMLGNGDGTFQLPLDFPAGPVPVFVAVGDFNRDGRQDLVTANYGANTYYSDIVASTVSVLLGNGDGTFQTAQAFEAGSGPHGIAVGDFNRDGVQDLAVADLGPFPQRATTAAVLLGIGDGTFTAPQTFDAGHALTGVAVGDFNRDGAQDLALSSGDDATASVLLGNGDGTFQPKVSLGAGSSPKSVAVGDFNGDQMPDLVVADHWSDAVSVILGNGDGTFLPRRFFETGRNPAWISVGDLNGDGRQDLAVGNWFATSVSVLAGNGDGTFQTGPAFGAGAAPEKVVLADFDGDGQLDMAVANYFSATVSVLMNRTSPPRVATPTFDLPGGMYLGPQTVALSVATPGATIHYSTDGSTPTAASTVYSGPISIARTTTIRALAVLNGMTDSQVASATYTVKVFQPTFNPSGGTYQDYVTVTLTTATSGATIRYTTDGSVPTTASAIYAGPISVTRTTTIRAMAVASGMVDSDAASATYTLQAATPTFNPPGGNYLIPQFVEISSASPGATIYYTTDGTIPTTSSTRYTGSILVLTTTTIRAIATVPGWSQSPVASATYRMPLD